MSDHILVLHPVHPFAASNDVLTLENRLIEIGFLGEKYNWFDDVHFRLGSQFFKFINFDHSHITILLENSQDGLKEVGETDSRYLCHIQITNVVAEPGFLGAANTLPPLCPNCDYEATDDPFKAIGNWYDNKANFMWVCPNCKSSFPIHELNWRKTAGFARQEIRIWEVQADEAVPTDELLAHLENITGEKWTYFYYHL